VVIAAHSIAVAHDARYAPENAAHEDFALSQVVAVVRALKHMVVPSVLVTGLENPEGH
jgi:hypothetical protein